MAADNRNMFKLFVGQLYAQPMSVTSQKEFLCRHLAALGAPIPDAGIHIVIMGSVSMGSYG